MKQLVSIFILLFSFFINIHGQSIDTSLQGSVKGITFDSAYNFALPAATVAVYNASDNSLIKYQLTDNFGGFLINKLPVGLKLLFIASYVGYKQTVLNVIIDRNSTNLDFKYINLNRENKELKEFVVTYVPPVRMNNDTIEFNADAFAADNNAVAEDLLSKLPGVVVWGDGTITVNGREVKSLKVNGKPFFGGDTKVATRNIPKTAINKVQVYNQRQDLNNRLDSVTEINIQLKKNKSDGYFGKIGGGYGSRDRHEADGSINFFSRSTQLGIVGATNNTNKVANDVNALLNNSTFKNNKTDLDFQSDFQTQGTNRPKALGLIFQHDFIPNSSYFKNNRLSGNYFLNNNNLDTRQTTSTLTYLGQDSVQRQNNYSIDNSSSTFQNLNAEYNYHYSDAILSIKPTLSIKDEVSHQESTSAVVGTGEDTLSSSYTNLDNTVHDKIAAVGVEYSNRFQLDYNFTFENKNEDQHKINTYISDINATENQNINRNYIKDLSKYNQQLYFLSNNLMNLFNKNPFWDIGAKFVNDLHFDYSTGNMVVNDQNSSTGQYISNAYLTNDNKWSGVTETPGLIFSKNILHKLSNRFEHAWDFSTSMIWQYYHQKNYTALHSFQNFSRGYTNYTPKADISYRNNQYGTFEDVYKLSFNTELVYPTVDQLFPLVDSSNSYYIQMGNAMLLPDTKRTLGFTFNHTSSRSVNTFNYNLSLSMGTESNNISDSSVILEDGKTYHYPVNISGSRFAKVNGQVKKELKLKKHELQFTVHTSLSLYRNPSYINSSYLVTNMFTNNSSVSITYMYGDLLSCNLLEQLSEYNSNSFNNFISKTYLNISSNVTKKLSFSNNLSYFRYSSTGSSFTHFVLWNASSSYRFLKSNNLEVNFSALDLLHQNKGVINSGSNTTVTHGTVNVLMNYFMFSVYYFPKHFGLRSSREKEVNPN